MVTNRHLRVCFGRTVTQEAHAFRHCDAVGIERHSVRAAIVADLAAREGELLGGPNRCRVCIDGQWFEFLAYKFMDGAINVGRITPIR